MTRKEEKWWAWQGLNLRPLRCQHKGYGGKAQKSTLFVFRGGGTSRERIGYRGDFYRKFAAVPA